MPDIKNMFIKGGLCLGGALVVTYSVVNNLTGAGALDDAFLIPFGFRLMSGATWLLQNFMIKTIEEVTWKKIIEIIFESILYCAQS